MGILDWFKNRPSQFDPEGVSDELMLRAIDKAVSLTNPRIKLLRAYQQRLAPAVQTSLAYLRSGILDIPSPIEVGATRWHSDATLRALFVSAEDVGTTLGRSSNLRKLFEKYASLDEAYCVLEMVCNEQLVAGMSLRGDVPQSDLEQKVLSFANHQVRICGCDEREVRRLLGTQAFEYLVAQALSEIGEMRSERRELEESAALIRARLRLLRQQGPGLGTVFNPAPEKQEERQRLELELLENERQLESLGDTDDILDREVDYLTAVLEQPERYISVVQKDVRLNAVNVVLDQQNADVTAAVSYSLADLTGAPRVRRAFVLARLARDELPPEKLNLELAERLL